MSKEKRPNKITARNAGWAPQFRFRGSCQWPGVREFHRSHKEDGYRT